MSIELKNLAEFQDMLKRRIAADTKRTGAQVVNKCALQVLIGGKGVKGAVHTTPKATKGRIRSDLNKKMTVWDFGGGTHQAKLLFVKASKLLKKQGHKFQNLAQWNALVSGAAQLIASKRDQSRAFLAAGWLQAALDLGRRTRTGTTGVQRNLIHPVGRAKKGYAVTATPDNLRVVCYNNSVEKRGGGGDDPVAYAIVQRGLDVALENARRDLEIYVVRKEYEQMLKKYSDK